MATSTATPELQRLDLSGAYSPDEFDDSGISSNIDGFYKMLENYTDPDNFYPDLYPNVSPATKRRVVLAAHELVAALVEADDLEIRS